MSLMVLEVKMIARVEVSICRSGDPDFPECPERQ